MKYLAIFCIIFAPALVFGATYTPLVGIPGVSNTNTDFNVYINSIYALSIGLAALLAVIKIVIAGVKWMLTDIVTSKEEAKKDIKGALIGLLIVLAAVLIISVINKDILKVNLTFDQISTPQGGNNLYGGAPITNVPQEFFTKISNSSVDAGQFKTNCNNDSRYTFKDVGGEYQCHKDSPIVSADRSIVAAGMIGDVSQIGFENNKTPYTQMDTANSTQETRQAFKNDCTSKGSTFEYDAVVNTLKCPETNTGYVSKYSTNLYESNEAFIKQDTETVGEGEGEFTAPAGMGDSAN